jgi:hypothetical protein
MPGLELMALALAATWLVLTAVVIRRMRWLLGCILACTLVPIASFVVLAALLELLVTIGNVRSGRLTFPFPWSGWA